MAEVRRAPLTDSEQAELRKVRSEWLAVGLSTEPADRPEAEAAVKDLYAVMGWKEPMTIWMESPLGGCFAAGWFESIRKGESKRGQLGDQLRGQLWGQLRDQLWGQLWDQLGGQLGDQLRGQLGDQISLARWGQMDAYLMAWLCFAREVGATYDKKLNNGLEAWSRVTRSCGWWWPREGVVILTERPTCIHRDPANRLHCEDGPAVAYPDGWGIWAWHGTRVEQEIIEDPKALTVKRITDEENAELRRTYMEIYGQGRYMKEAGGKLLDEVHEPPFPGLIDAKLWRLPNPDGGEPFVCVECQNSTPEANGSWKKYHLWVHPELRPLLPGDKLGAPQKMTAHNALASTYGERGESYMPCVES